MPSNNARELYPEPNPASDYGGYFKVPTTNEDEEPNIDETNVLSDPVSRIKELRKSHGLDNASGTGSGYAGEGRSSYADDNIKENDRKFIDGLEK